MDNGHSRLDLCIDRELMDAFAAFSGDRSPLHMDPAHGRRSMFGGNVVHGMLPLMFLSRLLPPGPGRITRIQGRFLKPVFPGDAITLTCTHEPVEGGDRKVLFEVLRSGTVATRGSLVLSEDKSTRNRIDAPARGLLTGPIAIAEHHFASLSPGMRTDLPFRWAGEQMAAYRDLLALVPDAGTDEFADPGTFAALAMLSTLVGMRMPGRTATFQEFGLDLHTVFPTGDGQLIAEVAFCSAATSTITQDIRFTSEHGPVATGKISVHVAPPPFKTPTMEELGESGTGFGLKDQVVLITGASRGIGATTAKLFALHGARVVINYRASTEEADAVVRDIRAYGGQAMAAEADVTDAGAVARMVREVEQAWGPVDVLVNNAAGNFRPIPFLETRWEQVRDDIDTILQGAFNSAQAVIPGFIAKGGGRIVNVSTIAVETPPAQQTKYVLAKSALNGLTRSLAVEFADRGVRVNMVVPSFVETDLTSGHSRVAVNQLKAASPMKRLATARDVADAILFLASPRSGYTTGQKLLVTGGLAPFL